MQGKRVVRGQVVLPALDTPIEKATIVVQVEDVSRADAPSVVIGEQRQHGLHLDQGAVLPFEIEVPEQLLDMRNSYSVRVHVDVSGSGEVDRGDLVSTSSYPVLTHGYGDEARVDVRLV